MTTNKDTNKFLFHNITRDTFRHLANEQNFQCISIYINTALNSEKPDPERSYTTLVRQCDEIEKELNKRNVKSELIKIIKRYLNRVFTDRDFWSNLNRLIAIFVNKEGIQYYTLPIKGKTLIYYSNQFYLKPILPHLKEYETFYIQQKMDLLKKNINNRSVSIEIERILPASASGEIDTLFVNEEKDVFGLYDHDNRTVIVDEYLDSKNESLVNTAMINALLSGAKIISLNPQDMPIQGTPMNAVLKT